MLEDEFVDILRKAKRGTRLDDRALAERSGFSPERLAAWTAGTAVPSDAQARTLATALDMQPDRFADAAAIRWHPDVAFPPNVRHRLQASTPNSNGYLLIAPDGTTAALIDPAGDSGVLLAAIAAGPYDLRYVLITHRHADHCERADAVAAAYPQAEFVISDLDAVGIGPLATRATRTSDGGDLAFTDGKIHAIHTPGHTDGSVCFLYNDVLFTGDTLFAGSVGGAFGERSTYADILTSIRTKLLTLDPSVQVMPGHGPPSTIAEELAHNPFFA